MVRTENDTWEITESVGATALGVAAGRAAETERENPLISDPFARIFLDAAGDGIWNFFAAPELPAEILEAEPDVASRPATASPLRSTCATIGRRSCSKPGSIHRRRAHGPWRGYCRTCPPPPTSCCSNALNPSLRPVAGSPWRPPDRTGWTRVSAHGDVSGWIDSAH
jgi:hypothetical protein